jgi:hypothetical protein
LPRGESLDPRESHAKPEAPKADDGDPVAVKVKLLLEGYQQLDLNVRELVDDAMAHIQRLLRSENYDEVIFSYDAANDTLGTGIFHVADEVKSYIFQNIMALEKL